MSEFQSKKWEKEGKKKTRKEIREERGRGDKKITKKGKKKGEGKGEKINLVQFEPLIFSLRISALTTEPIFLKVYF